MPDARRAYRICYRANINRIRAARRGYEEWLLWWTASHALEIAYPEIWHQARMSALNRFCSDPPRPFIERQSWREGRAA